MYFQDGDCIKYTTVEELVLTARVLNSMGYAWFSGHPLCDENYDAFVEAKIEIKGTRVHGYFVIHSENYRGEEGLWVTRMSTYTDENRCQAFCVSDYLDFSSYAGGYVKCSTLRDLQTLLIMLELAGYEWANGASPTEFVPDFCNNYVEIWIWSSGEITYSSFESSGAEANWTYLEVFEDMFCLNRLGSVRLNYIKELF